MRARIRRGPRGPECGGGHARPNTAAATRARIRRGPREPEYGGGHASPNTAAAIAPMLDRGHPSPTGQPALSRPPPRRPTLADDALQRRRDAVSEDEISAHAQIRGMLPTLAPAQRHHKPCFFHRIIPINSSISMRSPPVRLAAITMLLASRAGTSVSNIAFIA